MVHVDKCEGTASDQVHILMYGNMLMNSEKKLEMLIFTFPLWVSYWKCAGVFRFRGQYAEEAAEFVGSFPEVVTHVGTQFNQWRRQAAVDIESMNCEYIFQYLEDHMPTPTERDGSRILKDLNAVHADVLQYSWFPTYAPLLAAMKSHGADMQESLISLKIDKHLVRRQPYVNSLYYISLTSVIRRNLYTRILRSGRPIVRRYDPRAPFDVEQKPRSTWFLPLQYALPINELGICLDDDHLVEGSSAISRGLYTGRKDKRGNTHHARWSLRGLAFVPISTAPEHPTSGHIVKFAMKFFSRVSTVLDAVIYSVSALILNFRDSKTERNIRGRKARNT